MKEKDRAFPIYKFSGSHYEIGLQYGRLCCAQIKKHIQLVTNKLKKTSNVTEDQAVQWSLEYRPFVKKHAPYLDEEIQGVAEGSGQSLEAIYMLQLRAELIRHFADNPHVQSPMECSSFVVYGPRSEDGSVLAAHNADLPSFYRELCVVVRIVPSNAPSILMVSPAGQVSYIGINSTGVGVFGNYLKCDGWRLGFPRYLLTRVILSERTSEKALEAVRAIPRASSRNLLIFDKFGSVFDFENTVTKASTMRGQNGFLAHTNHYISPELKSEEKSRSDELENSRIRLERLTKLVRLHSERVTVQDAKKFLRDRESAPHAICRLSSDDKEDVMTIASVIAEPNKGALHVAVGPPNENSYQRFVLS